MAASATWSRHGRANASIRLSPIDQLILFGGFAPVNGI